MEVEEEGVNHKKHEFTLPDCPHREEIRRELIHRRSRSLYVIYVSEFIQMSAHVL
jgi:hypothetical protein